MWQLPPTFSSKEATHKINSWLFVFSFTFHIPLFLWYGNRVQSTFQVILLAILVFMTNDYGLRCWMHSLSLWLFPLISSVCRIVNENPSFVAYTHKPRMNVEKRAWKTCFCEAFQKFGSVLDSIWHSFVGMILHFKSFVC